MTKGGASLAQRLRSARVHAGLSQAQVANLMEMHRPTISQIEAGDRRVSAEELKEFARIYDVSMSWLIGEEKAGEDPRVLLAARDLAKLKKQDLDRVLDLLSSLRSNKGRGK